MKLSKNDLRRFELCYRLLSIREYDDDIQNAKTSYQIIDTLHSVKTHAVCLVIEAATFGGLTDISKKTFTLLVNILEAKDYFG